MSSFDFTFEPPQKSHLRMSDFFIAQELLKLIAFAGVVLDEGDSQKLLNQAHGAINDKRNPYPALASLYKNGG